LGYTDTTCSTFLFGAQLPAIPFARLPPAIPVPPHGRPPQHADYFLPSVENKPKTANSIPPTALPAADDTTKKPSYNSSSSWQTPGISSSTNWIILGMLSFILALGVTAMVIFVTCSTNQAT
jgi:hypothetical protein